MKKLTFLFLVLIALAGCYKNIGQVETKWGPAGKIECREDRVVYYYYFYCDEGAGYISDGGMFMYGETEGWKVVEITTDKAGNILYKRKYWKQPNS